MGEDNFSQFEPADAQTFDRDLEHLLANRPQHQEHALLWLEIEGLDRGSRQDKAASATLSQQVSKLLSTRVGRRAELAQLDTNRFAVLIRDRSAAEVLQVARVLRTVMHNTAFYQQYDVVYLGIHMGVVVFGQQCTKAELLAAAMAACCTAKQQGFNSIHVQRLG